MTQDKGGIGGRGPITKPWYMAKSIAAFRRLLLSYSVMGRTSFGMPFDATPVTSARRAGWLLGGTEDPRRP